MNEVTRRALGRGRSDRCARRGCIAPRRHAQENRVRRRGDRNENPSREQAYSAHTEEATRFVRHHSSKAITGGRLTNGRQLS